MIMWRSLLERRTKSKQLRIKNYELRLMIHDDPWLTSITHESPALMLLALVLIASLLIPLHHRVKHWIKEKMIEKNKAIRLAAAKKTIRSLSDDKSGKE